MRHMWYSTKSCVGFQALGLPRFHMLSKGGIPILFHATWIYRFTTADVVLPWLSLLGGGHSQQINRFLDQIIFLGTSIFPPSWHFLKMLFSHFWRWEISISLEGTLGEKMGPIHQVSLPFSGGGFLMQDPFNVEALFLLDQSDTYWMLTTATFAQRCWVFANATRPKIDRVTKNPHSWPSFWGSMFVFQSVDADFLWFV